ncbi:zinc finger miz domain-containing protein [Anaeramoeba flamelloides]|uniref:Zinc finger miz domain-containing protein n=1 Tax=Anaeramoeba flamelloides TaxID=1746091 RepID=A0AAV7ZLU6_9EUKA|nr:zinc finger miz domain-containing protein [Anaeramoeba flamelloides]
MIFYQNQKTPTTTVDRFKKALLCKINNISQLQKRELFTQLKNHYHKSKRVSYRAILHILFGDSLFFQPLFPPLIGPGIVNTEKSLQFVVPKERIEKIRNDCKKFGSKFFIRFLRNSVSQKKNQNQLLNVTVNERKFKVQTNKPIEMDLKLFDQEENFIKFDAFTVVDEIVIVFQHMKQVELTRIIRSIKERKTVSSKDILKCYNEIHSRNENENVNLSEKENMNKNESKTTQKKKKKKDDIISLNCPISKKPINVPVRTLKCKHRQCFDLIQYAKYAERTKNWRCPICKIPIKFSDLVVDGYVQNLIELEGKNQFQEFQIFPNGEWKKLSKVQLQDLHQINSLFQKNCRTNNRKRSFNKTDNFTKLKNFKNMNFYSDHNLKSDLDFINLKKRKNAQNVNNKKIDYLTKSGTNKFLFKVPRNTKSYLFQKNKSVPNIHLNNNKHKDFLKK